MKEVTKGFIKVIKALKKKSDKYVA